MVLLSVGFKEPSKPQKIALLSVSFRSIYIIYWEDLRPDLNPVSDSAWGWARPSTISHHLFVRNWVTDMDNWTTLSGTLNLDVLYHCVLTKSNCIHPNSQDSFGSMTLMVNLCYLKHGWDACLLCINIYRPIYHDTESLTKVIADD